MSNQSRCHAGAQAADSINRLEQRIAKVDRGFRIGSLISGMARPCLKKCQHRGEDEKHLTVWHLSKVLHDKSRFTKTTLLPREGESRHKERRIDERLRLQSKTDLL